MPKRASESESGDVSSGSLLLRLCQRNLTGKVSPDRAEDYEYDSARRLTNAYFDDGTYVGYEYDGFGRKVFRTEDYWHPEEGEKE